MTNRLSLLLIVARSLKQRRRFRRLVAFFVFPVGYLLSFALRRERWRLLVKVFLTDLAMFDGVVARRLRRVLPGSAGAPPGPANAGGETSEYIVLKPFVSGQQKGVISIHWRWHVDLFLRTHRMDDVLRRYMVILEAEAFGAEWTRPFLSFMGLGGDVFLATRDPRTIRRYGLLGFKTIPCGVSCDYIDSGLFFPVPGTAKDIDVIMVAHWSVPIKRHYALFRALQSVERPLNVALVGVPSGGYTLEDIRRIAGFYSLKHAVSFHEGIGQAEVNLLLNRSKVFVLTSLMEGPNRACFESFYADVPAIILSDNLGTPKEYFNEKTGLVVEERALPRAIEEMLRHHRRYSPRQWALENIAPEVTAGKVSAFLEEYSRRQGLAWGGNVAVKVWRGEKFVHRDSRAAASWRRDYEFIEGCRLQGSAAGGPCP